MPSRAQKTRLGVFVVLSLLALLALAAVITSRQFLRDQDIYYIAYENMSVGGLEVGSPVKYLGIKVGVVDDLKIDPADVGRVIVTVALHPGTPIKTDAEAQISSIGITGLKSVEIRGGSNEAPLLPVGHYIEAGSSVAEELSGRAEILSRKIEKVVDNLQLFTKPANLRKFTSMAEKGTAALDNLDQVLEDNRRGIREIIASTRAISRRMDSTSLLLMSAAGDIRRLVGSDTLQQILANTRAISGKLREADLVALIGEVREVADRTNRALLLIDNGLESGGPDFVKSMNELKTTVENLRSVSRMLSQDPSILLRGTKYKNLPDKHLE